MKNNKLSILVIGGAGYIGSHVTLQLCNLNHSVVVFDDLSTGHKINIDSRAKFVYGNILNPNNIKNVLKTNFDIIFHFAALKAASESMINPNIYSQVNLIGSINILNEMVNSNIKNIIFSSSAAVYGLPKYLPIDEKHNLNPINFYGFSKLNIENLLIWYSKLKNINFSILRYFNAAGYDVKKRILGKEKNPTNLLPTIMNTASGEKKSFNLFGNNYDTSDGTAIRDYIHVTDLAIAHVKSMDYIIKNKKNLIANLSSGKGHSVLSIIEKAKKITNKNINFNIANKRFGDLPILYATSEIANKKLDWTCNFSDIDTIISSMWEIYK